jgi:hypothetical protein
VINFISIFNEPFFQGLAVSFALMAGLVALYLRIFPKEKQKIHYDYLLNLCLAIQSINYKKTYIRVFSFLENKLKKYPVKLKKWKVLDKAFYSYNFFYISLLISIIPTIIVSIIKWEFQIVGPMSIIGGFSQFSLKKKNIQTFSGLRDYFIIIMVSTFSFSFMSVIGYIIKNQKMGEVSFYVFNHALAFSIYCLLFMWMTISTRIYIHKCSYGQQTKNINKINIVYLLKTIILTFSSVLIVYIIVNFSIKINLQFSKSIIETMKNNQLYLWISLLPVGFILLISILQFLLFLILYILLIPIKILISSAFNFIIRKKLYLYIFALTIVYFAGYLYIKYHTQ